ncbi:MAG: hypothetical protein AAB758_02745 [Patescibacteria group bacterium]
MPKLSPIQISLGILFMLGLGLIVANPSAESGPEERAYNLVIETLEKASMIPDDTAENLRQRLWLYIGVGQLARTPSRREFAEISEARLPYYRDLISTFALDDARRLYSKYLQDTAGSGSLFMSENEETFYTLWHTVDQLGISCSQIYNDRDCTAETFREIGWLVAKHMIVDEEGLLDQMRADPDNLEAAKQINRLNMRWNIWKDLPQLTERDRMRIATSHATHPWWYGQ